MSKNELAAGGARVRSLGGYGIKNPADTPLRKEGVRVMRKPYKTPESHKTPRGILGVDDLRGFALCVLSGSKTRKGVYLETI